MIGSTILGWWCAWSKIFRTTSSSPKAYFYRLIYILKIGAYMLKAKSLTACMEFELYNILWFKIRKIIWISFYSIIDTSQSKLENINKKLSLIIICLNLSFNLIQYWIYKNNNYFIFIMKPLCFILLLLLLAQVLCQNPDSKSKQETSSQYTKASIS